MSPRAAVIGSGKTARDIGLLLFRNGWKVTWLTGPAYADGLQTFVQRKMRHEDTTEQPPCVLLRGTDLGETPDVVIESRAEDLAAKREAFASIRAATADHTLLLTNSSSILPREIGPDIAGMHFFYPAALTAYAELILPEHFPQPTKTRVIDFAARLNLAVTRQNSKNAFYVNRVLLPLQAESIRLTPGVSDLREIDDAAVSQLLAVGPFSAADEIGLDVMRCGVRNYIRRMPVDAASDYSLLMEALDAWCDAGILGKKNKHRLLQLDEADVRAVLPPVEGRWMPTDLRQHLFRLFLNTCLTFIEQGECTERDLSEALSSVFGAERTVADIVRKSDERYIRDSLKRVFEETGISYFRPSSLLTPGAM